MSKIKESLRNKTAMTCGTRRLLLTSSHFAAIPVDMATKFGFSKGMKEKKTPKGNREEHQRIKTGQILELLVTNVDQEGFGQANHEGSRIQVNGALPNERVKAKVTFAGKRDIFAQTISIIEHSPHRIKKPLCSKQKLCCGCPFISMTYTGQLAWKTALVKSEISKYPSLQNAAILDTIPSPKQLQYRNSAKLVIAGKWSDPVIGIYRRNTHEVIDIEDCPLHHPLINKVVKAVKDGIRKGKVPIYHPQSDRGILRYLVVRVSETENKGMAVFVTAQRSFNEIHHLGRFLQEAVPEIAVMAQNVNASSGNVILGEKYHFLTQQRALEERLGHVKFCISPNSFFQINGGAAHIIYNNVREWAKLTGKESVLDLYCGVGGISLFLAASARSVLGIEVVKAAVADAERNASINGIQNCEFEAGDATELMEEVVEEEKPDVAVLNPPRKGCDESVLDALAQTKAEKIIYVSCSPQTLARDLNILSRKGYRVEKIQPVDMFPQTPHVENVAILYLKGAKI